MVFVTLGFEDEAHNLEEDNGNDVGVGLLRNKAAGCVT